MSKVTAIKDKQGRKSPAALLTEIAANEKISAAVLIYWCDEDTTIAYANATWPQLELARRVLDSEVSEAIFSDEPDDSPTG
jgi:hypothetical protein